MSPFLFVAKVLKQYHTLSVPACQEEEPRKASVPFSAFESSYFSRESPFRILPVGFGSVPFPFR